MADEGWREKLITYKLLRSKNGKLYPLYVEADRELPVGEWLDANVGPLSDEKHVKARIGGGGVLSLRPGFHSTDVPFADWIGVRVGDKLYQRPTDVWVECEVPGQEIIVTKKNGLQEVPDGWYRFKTNAKQIRPWIISGKIKINKVLSHEEVKDICLRHGLQAQPVAAA